ncbi:MAG: NADH-quinone oxidoreductase subunit J [Chloroflexota bacterium]
MEWVFYVSGLVAVFATVMVITELHAVHALLYLIVSLLAMALVFFALGAPFIAALEVIVYAGAIMVLFLFAVMMLAMGPGGVDQEGRWLSGTTWLGPGLLALVLFGELVYVFAAGAGPVVGLATIEPREVSLALFGPYILGVELASFLLMAGLVGAYHLGRRGEADPEVID